MWQEETGELAGEKDFPVLHDSKSIGTHVEHNDDDMGCIPYSSKFLWSEIFVIHAILS